MTGGLYAGTDLRDIWQEVRARGATRGGGGSKGSADPPEISGGARIGGGARFGDGARFGGGARSDINHAFIYFFLVEARSLQSFCSKNGPAPVINVVEDLFSQHFFFEGSVLTASAGARSSSLMLLARFGSNFFLKGARLDSLHK